MRYSQVLRAVRDLSASNSVAIQPGSLLFVLLAFKELFEGCFSRCFRALWCLGARELGGSGALHAASVA